MHASIENCLAETAASTSLAARFGDARRLSSATLESVPRAVRRPSFDPMDLREGILHLGCGAFHRAHQALLTQRAIEVELAARRRAGGMTAEPPPWGIVAASLHTPDTVRQLREQDGLFTVLERGPRSTGVEVVGTVRDQVFAPDEQGVINAWFANPAIRIVSLTVTTAGYALNAATGRLDPWHPDIVKDLYAAQPSSTIGILVDGLKKRRMLGKTPPVVISCDNLAQNGRALRQACIDFAALSDDRMANWIAGHVQFPCTMVDRIVPVVADEDRDEALAQTGCVDMVPVSTEPFAQWVIEHFDGARPLWDEVGAEFVADVGPWEASKHRLLNGGHLVIGYLGLLLGYESVAEAVADPSLAAFVMRFMLAEQKPTLPVSDHDIDAYAHQLLARWSNQAIHHRLDRICRDGSCKLPTRLLAGLQDNLRKGRPSPCTFLALAAWMCCLGTGRRQGCELRDQLSDRLANIAQGRQGDADLMVDGFLQVSDVFTPDMRDDPRVRSALVQALTDLWHLGPLAAVEQRLAGGLQ